MKSLKQTIYLETSKDFDFWCTVWSSGWCALAPFSYDRERRTLTRVQKLSSEKIVKAVISQKQRGMLVILAESYEKLDNDEVEELIEVTKTCLRLDEDLSPFYEMLEDYPTFSWVRQIGAGRSIRSPTVFEDVIKTICSTNCSWALTRAISHRLCSKIGDPFVEDFFTFPTPKQLASKTESFIKTEIKAGYRSPYLLELARKIVKGELDVETWKRSLLDSATLKREIMKIKGVGEYAADHILKLLGRYDFLALDSWLRKRFSKIHKRGEEAPDKEIEEFYAPFGKWRGLVLWLDMMKDYLIPEKGQM
jgi:N-glycosylase/DNA lyase